MPWAAMLALGWNNAKPSGNVKGDPVIHKELMRFLVTGSTNTAVCWLVYMGLKVFMPYTWAYTGAYVFGTAFTYYLNTRWVFRVPMSWRTFMQFPIVYILQYGLGVSLMVLLVNYWRCPEPLAPLVVVAMTVPVTFLLSRFILKRKVSKHFTQDAGGLGES